MANLPVGATFGSLVHAVLEHADPAAADFRAELLGHIDEQRGWWPVELDRAELADALVAVCDSPLGGPDGPLAGVTLRGVALSDRLREMDFELPLGGGDVRDRTADVRPSFVWATSRRCSSDTCPRAIPCARTPCRCAARSATSRCAAT